MSIIKTNLSLSIWPTTSPSLTSNALRSIVLVLGGVALIATSAKIQIPFYPVPVTLQTLVLLMIGMAYGFKLAVSTVVSYLAMGAIGIPVFASGAGIAYMAGPTGGYLFGFIISMALMGYLGDRGWGRTYKSVILSMTLGTAVIFACGVAWLSTLIGIEKALVGGLYPFLLGGLAKIIVAVIGLPSIWRLVERSKS